MNEKEWANKFIEWLKEVIGDSDKPLDEYWDAKIIESNETIWIKAESPKQPFNVFIKIERGFASLQVYPGIETAVMDSQERLKIYRDLLILSDRWRMVKYVIEGDNDDIVIKTDLDLSSLGREEFNDALTVTLLAMNDLVKKLGLQKTYEEAQIMHVLDIIKKKNSEGETKEQIVDYLIKTFGVSRDVAIEIVSQTLPKEDLEYFA